MGVKINCDGSLEEFVVPRHTIKLNRFTPKCVSNVCTVEEGDGPITLLAQMEFQSSNINIFAWQKGSESVINKYDYFPPPIDSDVLYGSIFVFRSNRRTNQVHSITSDLFERYIETCHRGFEDLGSDDSDDEEDSEDEMPNDSDVEFIDNRTLEEIEDDASVSSEEDDASRGSSSDEDSDEPEFE